MPRQMLESAKTKPERLNEGDDVLTMVILETKSTDMAGETRNREVMNPWNGDSAIASGVSSCLRVLVHNHRVPREALWKVSPSWTSSLVTALVDSVRRPHSPQHGVAHS